MTTAVMGGMVDLSGGVDHLTLSASGPNTIVIANVEVITGGTVNDSVTVTAAANLTLAQALSLMGSTGADVITFTQQEAGGINLGTGFDKVVLGNFANVVTIANVESLIGGTSADQAFMSAAGTVTMAQYRDTCR